MQIMKASQTLIINDWEISGEEINKHLSDFQERYPDLEIDWNLKIIKDAARYYPVIWLNMKVVYEDEPEVDPTQLLLFPPDSC